MGMCVEDQGWTKAQDLTVNDQITTLENGVVKVASIATDAKTHTTYNFEVADYHTYFVGESGLWVHNVCLEQINRIVSSALRSASSQGNISQAVRKLQRRQGDRESLGLFNGIPLNNDAASGLLRSILSENASSTSGVLKIFSRGDRGTIIFDSRGRGALFTEGGDFITFIEKGRGSDGVFR